jgi:hypothetical protein
MLAMMRQCGSCNLCCKLLPVPPLGKKAGERCKYLKFQKGCTVYQKPQMPTECQLWSCRWLVNNDTAEIRRPDHAHYVIDVMPDYITVVDNQTGGTRDIQIAQVWIDPKYPDAHRDPALRRWMFRRAQEGIATLVRYNSRDSLTIFPPPFDVNGQWHEITGEAEEQHSFSDVIEALGGEARMVIEDEQDTSRDSDRPGAAARHRAAG